QMHRQRTLVAPVDRTAKMHQAAVVQSGAELRPGCQQIAKLCIEHRGGYFRVLDGEGAAESAAAVQVSERSQFEAANFAEKTEWPLAHMQSAQPVATG